MNAVNGDSFCWKVLISFNSIYFLLAVQFFIVLNLILVRSKSIKCSVLIVE